MASDLHVMPDAPDPPGRRLYRVNVNVSGEGFDIDVTVDGIECLTAGLQRAVLAVLDEACQPGHGIEGGSDGVDG